MAANPTELESERTLLASLLVAPSMLDELGDQLFTQDFQHATHRQVWECLVALHAAQAVVDTITVAEWLQQRHGALQNWVLVVAELAEAVTGGSHARYHARKVADAALLRSMQRVCRQAVADAAEVVSGAPGQVAGYVEQVEAAVYEVGHRIIGTAAVQHVAQRLAHVLPTMRQAAPEGLPTGLSELDEYILGMRGGELCIIAARPGVGKTALALQLALNVANGGASVLVNSLEMTADEMVERLLCNTAEIDSYNMRKRRLGLEEYERIDAAGAELAKLRLGLCDDGGSTVAKLRSLARRWAAQAGGLDLIVVDYLQLMVDPSVHGDRVQEVTNISRQLKALARELRIPVVALCQLSRKGDEGEPRLSHLRDSGSIEQDADQVVLLWVDNSDAANVLRAGIAKNRHGRTGRIDLAYQPAYYRFACARSGTWAKAEAIYT